MRQTEKCFSIISKECTLGNGEQDPRSAMSRDSSSFRHKQCRVGFSGIPMSIFFLLLSQRNAFYSAEAACFAFQTGQGGDTVRRRTTCTLRPSNSYTTRQILSSTADQNNNANVVTYNSEDLTCLPSGIAKDYFVVQHYSLPSDQPFRLSSLLNVSDRDIDRLELSGTNVTLPIALILVDPDEYPTLSRARKACRKGDILIHRGPLPSSPETSADGAELNGEICFRGRVADRVYPGDVLGKQVRMGSGSYPILNHKKPPFDLPVIYEDDHCAIINKPAGVVTNSRSGRGHGIMTVRAALPFCVRPPAVGTVAVLQRPNAVHRLDKPTSGLLCIAKTKPAMVDLCRQFRERVVKKTYTAIINGIPVEKSELSISSQEAQEFGVDVDKNDEEKWQLIDSPLEEKHALTIWKAIRRAPCMQAKDGYLTVVELKPKTGRYHQLRRHMAWFCQRPLVGDKEYDGKADDAMHFREQGLFLCCNRVTFEHPYYNTEQGRAAWESLDDDAKYAGGKIWQTHEGKIMITAVVELPDKFERLMTREAG